MDIGRCIGDLLLLMFFLCLHRGIAGIEDDYDDTPNFGRCPWIRNKLKNGRVKLRYRGRVAKFVCDSGYELAGKRSSTCVRGQWNSPIPVCVARGCSRVPSVPNGRVTEMYRGALLVYDCNPGYALDGEASIHCDGRRWNANPPDCVIASESPETFCDFESSDLCGWSQDPNHDFDWFRNQHATPSGHVGTGPSYDHTFGENKGGFYLYIEASSPRKRNDVARLFSPVYPKDLSGGCFLFWYHMYGATTGGLRVYLKPESHVFDELSPRWQKSGDQGNQWQRGNMIVPVLEENFQIVIEGVRGESYVGDSAIDDVRLTTRICEDIDDTIDYTESTAQDSCRGRCREVDSGTSCGCNDNCYVATNCCNDYLAICGAGNDTVVTNTDEPSPFDHTSKTLSSVTATPSVSTLENTKGSSVSLTNTTPNRYYSISTSVTTPVSSTPSAISSSIISTAKLQTTTIPSVSSTAIDLNAEQSSTIKNTVSTLLMTSPSVSKSDKTTVSSTSTTTIPTSTKKIPTSTTTISASTTTISASTTKVPTSTTAIPTSTTKIPTSTTTISASTTTVPTSTTTKVLKPKIIAITSTFKPSTTTSPSSSSKSIQTKPQTPVATQTTQAKSPMTIAASSSEASSAVPTSSTTTVRTSTTTTTTAPVTSTQSSTTSVSSTSTSPAAITTLSSTRKTYNLRPRTKTTTPFSTTEYTTTPLAQTTKASIFSSTIGGTTASEVRTSAHYTTAWYRFTVSRSTMAGTTTNTLKPTSLHPTPTTKATTTTRTTKQSTFENVPRTTRFPYINVKSTQAASTTPSDGFESNASKALGGKVSSAAVISIVVVVIICLAGAGVFYVKRQRNKRQSKLSDDSEMRFLPDSDYMEYSDASTLDKIMSR